MPTTYIHKVTGAAFSEAAYRSRVENGAARKSDFVEAGSAVAAAAKVAAAPRIGPNDDSIHIPTGGRFGAAARHGWINTGRAKESDFAPLPGAGSAVAATPAPAAPPAPVPDAAATPAASGPAAIGYVTSAGLSLSPQAAANYLARGLCKPEDLHPCWPNQPMTGYTPVVAEITEDSIFPLDVDQYTRAQWAIVAEALGLDASGNKATLVDRINARGDAAGTAAAIAAL